MLVDTQAHLTDQGIAALRAGDHSRARDLLTRAVQLDSTNERAWLWLAGATDDPDERCYYLQQVMELNPRSDAAMKGLAELGVNPPQSLPALPSLLPPPVHSSAGQQTINLSPPEPEPPFIPARPLGADDALLVDYIVQELRMSRPYSEIVTEVSDRLNVPWSQAERLVLYVEEQRNAVAMGNYWFYMMVGGLVCVGIFVLGGLYLFGRVAPLGAISRVMRPLATRGMFSIATGTFILMGALLNLDWFMMHRTAPFLAPILGRRGARIVYGIVAVVMIVIGARMMGMR